MSNYNELYKSKIYQIVYSFGGLNMYPVTLFLLLVLSCALGCLFGLFTMVFTNNFAVAVNTSLTILMIACNLTIMFVRLPTRCRDDSVVALHKSEMEQFGCEKTDGIMQYLMFDLLYIDVYKRPLVALIAKIAISIVLGWLTYFCLTTYLYNHATLQVIVYIVLALLQSLYYSFVFNMEDQ